MATDADLSLARRPCRRERSCVVRGYAVEQRFYGPEMRLGMLVRVEPHAIGRRDVLVDQQALDDLCQCRGAARQIGEETGALAG